MIKTRRQAEVAVKTLESTFPRTHKMTCMINSIHQAMQAVDQDASYRSQLAGRENAGDVVTANQIRLNHELWLSGQSELARRLITEANNK